MVPIKMMIKVDKNDTNYKEKLPEVIYIMHVNNDDLLTIQDGKVERMSSSKLRQWSPKYRAIPTLTFNN